jgi:hypothetical protein
MPHRVFHSVCETQAPEATKRGILPLDFCMSGLVGTLVVNVADEQLFHLHCHAQAVENRVAYILTLIMDI